MSEENPPVICTIADLRAINFCGRGSRAFLEAHGINWTEFLKHGVESTIVEKIDDEMVRAVIQQARLRTQTGNS